MSLVLRFIMTLVLCLAAAGQLTLHAQAAPPAQAPADKTAKPPAAQTPPPATKPAAPAPADKSKPPVNIPAGTAVPPDYVIGPEDVLTIVFWREKDLSSEVIVRPDGKISLPVLQDVAASGLTPEQLRESLTKTAERYVEDPNVTVVVKQINSRRVFITGQVSKPGPYALTAPMTVIQLISLAGGVLEFADDEKVLIMRTENGKPVSFRFNYQEVKEGKNLTQNIPLKPGDTVIVP